MFSFLSEQKCYIQTCAPPLSGVNTGGVGSYIYDDPEAEAQS